MTSRTLKLGTTVGQRIEYSYKDNSSGGTTSGQISSVSSTVFGKTTTTTYSYDNNGNITSISIDGVVTYRYAYDHLGQLIREDNKPLDKSYVWTYDNAGNITSKKTYAFTVGILGTVQSTVNYTYGNGSWGDLLTNDDGSRITYDEIGNPLEYSWATFTWNGRKLSSCYDGEYVTVSYGYNSDGIRVYKEIYNDDICETERHDYGLNGTQILYEIVSIDSVEQYTVIYVYDENGSPIGLKYREPSYAAGVFDSYVYEKNLQGDIIGIYNASGTKIRSYNYDAWGKVTFVRGTTSTDADYTVANMNPFLYRGYYYDSETGFYYVSSRYYDPEIGRWINADDANCLGAEGELLSYNLFAYCLNNPVNRTDVNGNWSLPNWAKVAIGAVALAGAIALTVATGGGAAAVAVGVAKVVGSVVVSTAVSAGVGYLENGKQGAIDGACNGFMFSSLSALGGSALKYGKIHAATTGSPNSIGKAGEKMAGIDQYAKQSINVDGRIRIPDALNSTTLIEVKNVKYISNTQQLKDFATYAGKTGRSLELYVRPTTKVAKTVINAGWKIKYLW